MRRIFLLFMMIFLIGAPLPAQAGILEFFFPSLKKEEYNPYKTLKAPFAERPDEAIEGTPKPTGPLDVRHRTTSEIARWLAEVTPVILSFNAVQYRQEVQDKELYFDQNGLGNFSAFLQKHKFVTVLDTGKYNVHSVADGAPLVLNEGVVGGRYRWLFEVPMMVTYIDSAATGYESTSPVNRYFSLNVQVGRVQNAENEHNILIETWDGQVK